jgi:hypothetical protein
VYKWARAHSVGIARGYFCVFAEHRHYQACLADGCGCEEIFVSFLCFSFPFLCLCVGLRECAAGKTSRPKWNNKKSERNVKKEREEYIFDFCAGTYILLFWANFLGVEIGPEIFFSLSRFLYFFSVPFLHFQKPHELELSAGNFHSSSSYSEI